MRKTKIICTLGPACNNEATIEQMLKNGMNVARFNFSHGTHEYHYEMMKMFRAVRDRLKLPAAVMLDTKGPEIRLGTFEGDKVTVKTCDEFTLTTRSVVGNEREVSISYADLPSQLIPGTKILIDDGKVLLRVKECTETDIICTVEFGGIISNRKSINIPRVHLSMPYMSKQDEEDVIFGIEQNVDFIAASFVRSKEDMITLRKFVNYHGGHNIKLIAKIENNEGVDNFDDILKYSDGIMVARGDMGVEIEYERLPGIQKKFIRKCYQSGKMVITATQMLESMIHSKTPTRAEITDVANAVFDGTSAVMLSGETAAGDHPALVVKVMSKIARQAEADAFDMFAYQGINYDDDYTDVTNAICDAAATTARDIDADAIIAVTKSGFTARRVSKFRPKQPIIAATPELTTFHQLSLSWGVFPVLSLNQTDTDSLFTHAVDCAKQIDLVSAGDKVVITAGVPLNLVGMTNLLKVQIVQ
ncbi:MAG: pyruvate kinase [Clostridia bacterium]|nr:pyruvate kinase [Clostridia bacterium]MDY3784733.1 pyruvate kinase [Eubacteriales bacterium]